MKKHLNISLFILLAVIQLLVPAKMIFSRQSVLALGEEYKFRVVPVDPYDPFRGRYLTIRIENDRVLVDENTEYRPGQTVYAKIVTDEDGFAGFSGISENPPKSGSYVKTRINYIEYKNYDYKEPESSKPGFVHLDTPFDRYYMPEDLAPIAEKVYSKKIRDTGSNVYVIVKIKDGIAVIDKLYINGETIEDFIKRTL